MKYFNSILFLSEATPPPTWTLLPQSSTLLHPISAKEKYIFLYRNINTPIIWVKISLTLQIQSKSFVCLQKDGRVCSHFGLTSVQSVHTSILQDWQKTDRSLVKLYTITGSDFPYCSKSSALAINAFCPFSQLWPTKVIVQLCCRILGLNIEYCSPYLTLII